MPVLKYKVTLTEEERGELKKITEKGKHNSQKVLNALILLNCDEGKFQKHKLKNHETARVLNIGTRKIDHVKRRFVEEGLGIALSGHKGQRLYKRKADGDFEAHLVALSCSQAPEGYKRWTLRLLAEKVVELQIVEQVSYQTVRRVLKKHFEALAG